MSPRSQQEAAELLVLLAAGALVASVPRPGRRRVAFRPVLGGAGWPPLHWGLSFFLNIWCLRELVLFISPAH